MHRISPHQTLPLMDAAATRRIEERAKARLASHTLMQRAGLAVARLARAIAPHAQRIWVVCGAGNNGGDGLEAAVHLHVAGVQVYVTWLGDPARCPQDARLSWLRACDAGVAFTPSIPQDLQPHDLCIDALLGLGLSSTHNRPASPALLAALQALHKSTAPVLCIDVPSGLDADSGQYLPGLAPPPQWPGPRSARYTLSLLTLKPGLFTGSGRDAAGQVWFDDLGCCSGDEVPCAYWGGAPAPQQRPQASHKGLWGDVAIVGGQGLTVQGQAMTGAALLAASAALHGGAGRVMAALLDAQPLDCDPQQPEIMLRHFEALALDTLTVVGGCGGGAAIVPLLPALLAQAPRLVLDADALNAIAADPDLPALVRQRAARGQTTVLTPHPLEAARLLGRSSAQVQNARLPAAQELAQKFACAVVLKGSGSIIAAPGRIPHINPTGNARLASAGTGDVLAGLIGAYLAAQGDGNNDGNNDGNSDGNNDGFAAARRACWMHGQRADDWPTQRALTASRLARSLGVVGF